MWTSTFNLDPKRAWLTRLIGRFSQDIYFSAFSPLQVQNLPRQSLPFSSWVRVRNRLAGISGSDLRLIYGNEDFHVAPAATTSTQQHIYPGHELVGEVIEIGHDVQRLNVGDHVALRYGPNCLSAHIEPPCRSCASGNYNLCENSMHFDQSAIGGGWSEEMLVHEQQLFPLPSTLSDEQAIMLEPAATALHAILRQPPLPDDRVLVIGAGTIGLLTTQLLRVIAPHAEISVMARHPFQVEQATRLGAAHIIYPQDADSGVQRATGAKLYRGFLGKRTLYGGYDIVYDTVGQKTTLQQALRWARAQGTVVLVGLHPHMMHVDLTPLWHQEIKLVGSTSHGVEMWPPDSHQRRSTFSIVADLMEHGRIHPEQLITHHFALNNYKHALISAKDKVRSHAIKVIFDYSLLPASVVPNVRASGRLHRSIHTGALRAASVSIPSSDRLHAQSATAPERSSTPYEPTIQVTPPVAPLDEKALLKAMSYANDEAEEDTAIALPAISKHYRATPRKAIPPSDHATTASPQEAHHAVSAPDSPDPSGTEPSQFNHETENSSASNGAHETRAASAQPAEPAVSTLEQASLSTDEPVDIEQPTASHDTSTPDSHEIAEITDTTDRRDEPDEQTAIAEMPSMQELSIVADETGVTAREDAATSDKAEQPVVDSVTVDDASDPIADVTASDEVAVSTAAIATPDDTAIHSEHVAAADDTHTSLEDINDTDQSDEHTAPSNEIAVPIEEAVPNQDAAVPVEDIVASEEASAPAEDTTTTDDGTFSATLAPGTEESARSETPGSNDEADQDESTITASTEPSPAESAESQPIIYEEIKETNDDAVTLPYVEETPTVRIQPHPRHRKKRSGGAQRKS